METGEPALPRQYIYFTSNDSSTIALCHYDRVALSFRLNIRGRVGVSLIASPSLIHIVLMTSLCPERAYCWDPRRRVLMLHVDFKKYICRPVEFKKCSCHPVEFKKLPCPMALSLQISCRMSPRSKRPNVTLSILGV